MRANASANSPFLNMSLPKEDQSLEVSALHWGCASSNNASANSPLLNMSIPEEDRGLEVAALHWGCAVSELPAGKFDVIIGSDIAWGEEAAQVIYVYRYMCTCVCMCICIYMMCLFIYTCIIYI